MRLTRFGLLFCLSLTWGTSRLQAGDVSVATTGDTLVAAEKDAVKDLSSLEAYAAMLGDVIDYVGEGEFDAAIKILDDNAARPTSVEDREKLKRLFAGMYSGGGKFDGHELVAVQSISGRLHKVYALAYYERQPVLYVFTMYQFAGKWKIAHLHWNETLDPLEKVAPSHFLAQ